jgi:hypothetical protein
VLGGGRVTLFLLKKKIVEAHIAMETIQKVIPTKSEPFKKP